MRKDQKGSFLFSYFLVVAFVFIPISVQSAYFFEFSVDIGSDSELSDPSVDGDEGFDPGDVYRWKSSPVPAGGRDGDKDDAVQIESGRDPFPDPPDASTPPATAVPVGSSGPESYRNYLDVDGHDKTGVFLSAIISGDTLKAPIARFAAPGIHSAGNLAVSFDDDGGAGWPGSDVPTTGLSPAGRIHGNSSDYDEIVSVVLNITAIPFLIDSITAIADEEEVHASLSPNPDFTGGYDDDDLDSLDILEVELDLGPAWLMSVDYEASWQLDPGDIYEVMPGSAPRVVIDDVLHLGLRDSTDIDAFEVVWLYSSQIDDYALTVLFSVDDDDPLTREVDESGGLDPRMIYASFLTGSFFALLEVPLVDDIDGLASWYEEIAGPSLDWGDAPEIIGTPGYPVRLANDGAFHRIGGPWLGDATDMPDDEVDGQPDINAAGDDNDGNDDENGVQIPVLIKGRVNNIIVEVSGGGGFVEAWIDYNRNFIWQDYHAEQINIGFLPDGVHTIPIVIHPAVDAGQTFARFRISSEGGLAPTGEARDGEVEDYPVTIEDGGFVEHDVFPRSLGHFELIMPNSTSERISATGPSTHHVFFKGDVEGSAEDYDNNGRDEVQTELVELDLKGTSPTLGPVSINVHPVLSSQGGIEELENIVPGRLDVPPFSPPGYMAESFFDIFFEIEVRGQVLHNNQPAYVFGRLKHKPPTSYMFYSNCFGPINIELFDENNQPTGFSLGCINYHPVPKIEVDVFDFSIIEMELIVQDIREQLWLTGSAEQHVYFERELEGSAYDFSGDGLDEVYTELVSLDLAGVSPTFGPVSLTLHPDMMSGGQIEEVENKTIGVLDVPPFGPSGTVADSFFDIYYEIDVGGEQLFSQVPMRLEGVISHKPPGPEDLFDWCQQSQSIQLVDVLGQPVNVSLGCTHFWPQPPTPCQGDSEPDGDVDGIDAAELGHAPTLLLLSLFAEEFGRTDCLGL